MILFAKIYKIQVFTLSRFDSILSKVALYFGVILDSKLLGNGMGKLHVNCVFYKFKKHGSVNWILVEKNKNKNASGMLPTRMGA